MMCHLKSTAAAILMLLSTGEAPAPSPTDVDAATESLGASAQADRHAGIGKGKWITVPVSPCSTPAGTPKPSPGTPFQTTFEKEHMEKRGKLIPVDDLFRGYDEYQSRVSDQQKPALPEVASDLDSNGSAGIPTSPEPGQLESGGAAATSVKNDLRKMLQRMEALREKVSPLIQKKVPVSQAPSDQTDLHRMATAATVPNPNLDLKGNLVKAREAVEKMQQRIKSSRSIEAAELLSSPTELNVPKGRFMHSDSRGTVQEQPVGTPAHELEKEVDDQRYDAMAQRMAIARLEGKFDNILRGLPQNIRSQIEEREQQIEPADSVMWPSPRSNLGTPESPQWEIQKELGSDGGHPSSPDADERVFIPISDIATAPPPSPGAMIPSRQSHKVAEIKRPTPRRSPPTVTFPEENYRSSSRPRQTEPQIFRRDWKNSSVFNRPVRSPGKRLSASYVDLERPSSPKRSLNRVSPRSFTSLEPIPETSKQCKIRTASASDSSTNLTYSTNTREDPLTDSESDLVLKNGDDDAPLSEQVFDEDTFVLRGKTEQEMLQEALQTSQTETGPPRDTNGSQQTVESQSSLPNGQKKKDVRWADDNGGELDDVAPPTFQHAEQLPVDSVRSGLSDPETVLHAQADAEDIPAGFPFDPVRESRGAGGGFGEELPKTGQPLVDASVPQDPAIQFPDVETRGGEHEDDQTQLADAQRLNSERPPGRKQHPARGPTPRSNGDKTQDQGGFFNTVRKHSGKILTAVGVTGLLCYLGCTSTSKENTDSDGAWSTGKKALAALGTGVAAVTAYFGGKALLSNTEDSSQSTSSDEPNMFRGAGEVQKKSSNAWIWYVVALVLILGSVALAISYSSGKTPEEDAEIDLEAQRPMA